MLTIRDFLMPDLGEGLTEGEINRWLVAEGDVVVVDQPIAEITTEQAVVEVPTPFAGRVATLHGAGLLNSAMDSTGLESYGSPGPGRYITIYANAGHAFLVVAGRAFDTANFGGPNIPAGDGPRWRSDPTGNLQDGGYYVVRHPPGE